MVAEVTVREIADDASWLAKKAALREEALRQRQAEVQESYVAALKKSATIVKNDELLAPAARGGLISPGRPRARPGRAPSPGTSPGPPPR